jgi:uncharacterized membrane protein YcaP (DUF421 family)
MNLHELFSLSVSPVELVIRGSAIYWFLFLIFRFVMRRDTGSIAIADVLLLVIVADAAQNAMSGGYTSITDGMILVGVIVGWNYALDWASFHFDAVRRFSEPPPLLLIQKGRILHRNLRREYITVQDLLSLLRQQGIDDVGEVKKAYLEGDGQFSVITLKPGAPRPAPKKKSGYA